VPQKATDLIPFPCHFYVYARIDIKAKMIVFDGNGKNIRPLSQNNISIV
jgi:hypothetical protein